MGPSQFIAAAVGMIRVAATRRMRRDRFMLNLLLNNYICMFILYLMVDDVMWRGNLRASGREEIHGRGPGITESTTGCGGRRVIIGGGGEDEA